MLPSSAAIPAESPFVVARLRARCHTTTAAWGPSAPNALIPARRMLSTASFAERRAAGQALKRATSRTRKESRHAIAYAAAILPAASSSPRRSDSLTASRTVSGRPRTSRTSEAGGKLRASSRRESEPGDCRAARRQTSPTALIAAVVPRLGTRSTPTQPSDQTRCGHQPSTDTTPQERA